MADLAMDLFVDVLNCALPFAVVFAIGNLVVCTFLRAAFGGKLWFGK